MSNGKGSTRRKENYNKISVNWDDIEWRRKGEYCIECGRTFNKNDKRKYNKDGSAQCVECNFN